MNTRLFTQTRTVTLAALLCGGCLLVARGAVLRELRAFITGQPAVTERAPQTHAAAPHAAAPLAAPVQSRSNYTLPQTVLAGGGGESSGGSFATQGTIGQSVTGVSNGGGFTLESGFWPNGTAPCAPVSVNLVTLPVGTAGNYYSQSSGLSAGSNPVYVISFGSLPPGLALNSLTGALTGTPTATGSYNFSLSVSSSCANLEQAYVLQINCPTIVLGRAAAPPTPTTDVSLPSGATGVAYSVSLAATPASETYEYTIEDGDLPPNFTLDNSTGLLTGLPQGGLLSRGVYRFTVSAQGFGACAGTQQYQIAINPKVQGLLTAAAYDFDGDGKSDLWSYQAREGRWLMQRSSDNTLGFARLGSQTETAVPADYDGDGKTDVAVFNAAAQRWQIVNSRDGATREAVFGSENAQAYPADYDGDGKADLAVRQANGEWQIRRSRDGELISFALGTAEDTAVIGDFDGDGLTDAAVYRASEKLVLIRHSCDGAVLEVQVPYAEGTLWAADFDGDTKAELAFWSAERATLSFKRSSDQQEQQLTINGSELLLGDYDGDGKSDCASWQKIGWQMRLSSRAWE